MCFNVYNLSTDVSSFSFFYFVGGDNEGLWLLPDILVNVVKSGDDTMVGVVQEVLAVCSFFNWT